jgi:hypothetical protein
VNEFTVLKEESDESRQPSIQDAEICCMDNVHGNAAGDNVMR